MELGAISTYSCWLLPERKQQVKT